MEVGTKDAVLPVGSPVAASDTTWAVPALTAVEIVDVLDDPAVAVDDHGAADSEKSFACVAPQPGNENDPMRVRQVRKPSMARYSLVYQSVQPSEGSTLMLE